MRLIGKPPKQDPVKAAIYHPKEFRGRRLFVVGPGGPGGSRMGWRSILLVSILAGVASYFWSGNITPPRVAAVPLPPSLAAARPVVPQSPVPQPVPQATSQQPGTLEVRMSSNGYVTPGAVNGVPVSFMVDTGASHVSLPAALAQQAGIRCEQQGQSSTANGIISACAGIASEVTFGPFRLTNIAVTIMPNARDALLGMDALRRFTMTWSGDVVRIAATNPGTVAQVPASASTPSQALPPTGTVERLRQEPPGTAYAPLKLLGNRDGKHCMFRLEDWQSGAPVLAVFVRSGEVTETTVPLGQYRGKVACGSTWYGAQLFGPGTAVDELNAPVVFTRNASGSATGMMIELTQRLGGNLQSQQSQY